MSRTLRFEERSVFLCARYLREAGFISQAGRGPSAAHMMPKDATNLLLGIMASDTIQDAPKSVKLAREADLTDDYLNGRSFTDPAPHPFLKDESDPRSLGAALDALFDEIVRHGHLRNDTRQLITNFVLKVRRPGLYAEITVGDLDSHYHGFYRRTDPWLESLTGAALHSASAKILRQDQTAMKTVTEIDLETIHIIADTLRGREPKQGEIVRPLYLDADAEADG